MPGDDRRPELVHAALTDQAAGVAVPDRERVRSHAGEQVARVTECVANRRDATITRILHTARVALHIATRPPRARDSRLAQLTRATRPVVRLSE